ncbi:MAG: c-type cytochrome domain-containing protein [Pirellulales bacterium]
MIIRSRVIRALAALSLFQAALNGHGIRAQDVTKPAEATSSTAAQEVKKTNFSSQIAPILQANCVSCHSAKKSEGGYRIDTFHDLMQPGDSSATPVVAAKADESLLIQRITSSDPSIRMPPESDPLTNDQVQAIRQWISEGAVFDGKEPKQLLALVSPPPRYANPPAKYPAIPITAVCFSPDGTQLVTAGYHELTVWDAASGTLARRIANIGQRVYAINFNSDGKSLAVACGEPGRIGEVRIVDWASGEVASVVARSVDVVLDVAIRPGRDEIAVAAADHSVRIINYRTGDIVRAYSSHADWVTAIAFSADGNKLVSASRDKSAKVFDLESGQMLVNYAGHGLPVRGVAFAPDGAQVVSVGDDKKLHRWNVADAKKLVEVGIEGEGFHLIRADNMILIPSAGRRVLKLDLSNNKIAATLAGLDDWALSCCIAADGRIAAGSASGIIKLWAADGKELKQWSAAP